MRARSTLGIAAALFAAATAALVHPGGAPAGAAGPHWLAGAAARSISPVPHSPADDARDFPGCDTTVFNGPRRFDFEEPYIDVAGTGVFDYTRDPYCDANHNGRHDDLYSAGGVDHILRTVHDDIEARAFAIGDGTRTVVIEELSSTGTFNSDIERIRQAVRQAHPEVTEVIVGSTHNESSPDPLGIYGAPADPTGTVGLHSGVDDYYMSFMVAQAARAAGDAVAAMRPARLRVTETTDPEVRPRLSTNFPTTNDDGSPAAVDPKLRILQAVDATSGANIETLLDYAAHNQQTGHASDPALALSVSDDWPGVYAATVEASVGGQAMFVPAGNGSIEDPHMVPDTVCPHEGCWELPQATGANLAQHVLAALPAAEEVAPHDLSVRRDVFDVPLQNTLFAAAFGAGLFAHRTVAADVTAGGQPAPSVTTEVGLIDLGPQVAILVNPGESFPALLLGSPWGEEDAGCPQRGNPPVPAWQARAQHRFEMGLGDDMIGYLIPAWGWGGAAYVAPDTCANDPSTGRDPRGHPHKLEDESVGPVAGNLVAQHLAALAASTGDGGAVVAPGRFLTAAGALTRRGADSPVGAWVLPAGGTTLAPGSGVLIGTAGVSAFGGRAVDAQGVFIDYDGRAQAGPDITTRGMAVTAADGTVTRYYLDVYPPLTGSGPGPAASGAAPTLHAAAVASLPLTVPRGGGGGPLAAALLGMAALAARGLRRR